VHRRLAEQAQDGTAYVAATGASASVTAEAAGEAAVAVRHAERRAETARAMAAREAAFRSVTAAARALCVMESVHVHQSFRYAPTRYIDNYREA
jgi:hypothetical protein